MFYTYTVKSEWTLIYSSNEKTEKTYFVEQEELLLGLEKTKPMKENEIITLFFHRNPMAIM